MSEMTFEMKSRNTHLPVRERARIYLQNKKKYSRPTPPELLSRSLRVNHLQQNVERYAKLHGINEAFLEEFLGEDWWKRPTAGGPEDIRTLAGLKRLLARELDELQKLIPPTPEVSEAEIDSVLVECGYDPNYRR